MGTKHRQTWRIAGVAWQPQSRNFDESILGWDILPCEETRSRPVTSLAPGEDPLQTMDV